MKDILEHLPETTKAAIDTLSWMTVVATVVKFLPAIAAVFSIIWSCIRIYESDTVQKWLGKKGDGK